MQITLEQYEIEENDSIEIDIPNRTINLAVETSVLEQRPADMDAKGKAGWTPDRDRVVSTALKAYGALTSSAAKGAVRDIEQLNK